MKEELLELSQAGDKIALERLLLLNYDWLLIRVRQKIPQDLSGLVNAEDILQETFVRVFRSIRQFKIQSLGTFEGWLATIADHQLIDAMKRRRRERRASTPAPSPGNDDITGTQFAGLIDQVVDQDDQPQRRAMLAELGRLLPVAMAGLLDEQREVLRLRYLDGLSLEEVAETLGRTCDSVRSLSHRGRQQLRERLVRLSIYI